MEPESELEPKLSFQLIFTAVSLEARLEEEKPPLRHISYGTLLYYSFKWQYRSEAGAGAGAGAGAEVMDKGGAGAENKQIRLHNTAFLPPLEEFFVVLEISHDKFKKSKLQVLY